VVVVTKNFFHGYFDTVFDEFVVEVADFELLDAAGGFIEFAGKEVLLCR
jgi:hypothetical protein